MFSLIVGVIFALIAIVVLIYKMAPHDPENERQVRGAKMASKAKNALATLVLVIASLSTIFGSISYNDAGYCTHAQTAFGTEEASCSTGWFYTGWGRTTAWPHYVTIANTNDESMSGSSVRAPYPVRLSDNWNGDVTQSTRFAIPQDTQSFMVMHRTFRSPERLITTTLKPAVSSSLDSVSNLFSMEDYYAGGKRDEYKTEYRDAVTKGRPKVKQVVVSNVRGATASKMSSSDSDVAKDTSDLGNLASLRTEMQKVTVDGLVVREAHGYVQYGITVASAILENLDPDDLFEQQMQSRKDAASRRIVAQESRKEQEEQRLLAIQTGQTNIAKRQASAQVEQIAQTTEAETTKKLALIAAERMLEEADIARQTALIKLERAKIDAQAVTVSADATAYEKRVVLEADGALQQKLDAHVKVQKFWANAAAQINVPTQVFGGGGNTGNALGTVDQFMQIMTMQSAKALQVDTAITK